jgi:hypothetical protein
MNHEQVYVSDNCPVPRTSSPLFNLRAAKFAIVVEPQPVSQGSTVGEIFGYFKKVDSSGDDGDIKTVVFTGALALNSRRVGAIGASHERITPEVERHVGQIMCDRAEVCTGPQADGRCPALGAASLESALGEVLETDLQMPTDNP